MKKILALICILSLFTFLSPTWAIDRTSKGSDKEKKEDTTGNKTTPKEGATQKSRSEALSGKIVRSGAEKYKAVSDKVDSDKKKSKPKERYDYFRDANNNGVDDRLEKKTKKEEVKPTERTAKDKPVPSKIVPATPKQDIPKPKGTKESPTREPKKEVKPKSPSKRSDKDDN